MELGLTVCFCARALAHENRLVGLVDVLVYTESYILFPLESKFFILAASQK